jgi:hypothetical protein
MYPPPVDPVDAVGVEARHRRAHRLAARGHEEGVVPDPLPAGRHDLAGRQVDALGAGADPDLDLLGGEVRGGAREEHVAVGHEVADPVGDPAGGVGDLRSLLEDDDLEVLRRTEAARLGGR